MIPYRNIEQAEQIQTPLSNAMISALGLWYDMYMDQSPWKKDGTDGEETVKTMNLPALICSEVARQVVLEMKVTITGKEEDAEGNAVPNDRSEYLAAEYEKLQAVLRQKLEQGCAAGGMVIKPYPNTDDGHIYFDYAMDWSIYPMGFDDDGYLSDVIIPDTFKEGKEYYTRLERHKVTKGGIEITQRAFKSSTPESLGQEVDLASVERWAALEPKVIVKDTDGALFGWYKVANANNIDLDCPLGASVYSKAAEVIKEADTQYSRLLWEYKGSELAIDVDPTALMPKSNGSGYTVPALDKRLFRGVDTGADDTYSVFSPAIRDASLVNGLNQILMKIEDLVGLARGTISDANIDARTATELKIVKQRSYATVADNQKALERCLRDVIRVMDKYATLYSLAPEGEYDVAFEWDDSIITDMSEQLTQRLLLMNNGVISREELRQWYFGESEAQAKEAIANVLAEAMAAMPQVEEPQGV